MNATSRPHVFWGNAAPLAALTGGGLFIMASARLAYALVTAAALLWVYCLSAGVFQITARFFPRKGRTLCWTFLASFLAGIFQLLLWLLSPLTALEMFFVVSLVPFFCIASGVFTRVESFDSGEAISRAAAEAAVLGVLIVLFALVREPLGFLSLSLPGGAQGIVLLFSFEKESFLPVHIIASSSGALLLLGYGVGLYRHLSNRNALRETDI